MQTGSYLITIEPCAAFKEKCVMMTPSNGNIFRVTGHLCVPGEFPAQRPVTQYYGIWCWSLLAPEWTPIFTSQSIVFSLYSIVGVVVTGPPQSTNWSGRVLQAISSVMSFDVFSDLRPNKRLSKQWWGWWFGTPSSALWRHCNGIGVQE